MGPAATVLTASQSATCGYNFKVGATYLIYARDADCGSCFSTHMCTRTRLLEDAAEDLDELNDFRGNALTLTSWGRIKILYDLW